MQNLVYQPLDLQYQLGREGGIQVGITIRISMNLANHHVRAWQILLVAERWDA